MPSLSDHRTGQVAVEGRNEAERLSWSFKGGHSTLDIAMDAMIAVKFWAEEVGRSQVAQRRQEEGTHIVVVAEWMHSGRPLVAP